MATHPLTGEKLIAGVNADLRGGQLRPRNKGFGITERAEEFGKRQLEQGLGYLDKYRTQFGLPQLEQSQLQAGNVLRGLEQQVEDLPSQIKGESRGFDVNAAQLAQIQQQRQTPLLENVSRATRAYQGTTEALGLGRQAYQSAVDFLSSRMAETATGFTSALRGELDLLVDKYQRQGALDEIEAKKLATLAIQEDEYEREKELARVKAQAEAQYRAPESPGPGYYLGLGAQGTTTPSPTSVPTTGTPQQPGLLDQLWEGLGSLGSTIGGYFG